MEVHIHIDDRLVDAVKTVTRNFTRRRVAAIASLSVVATSFVADAAPVGNLIEFQYGGEIDHEQFNDNFGKLRTAIDALFIRDERTISVNSCEELISELNDLEEARILPGGSVTIEIATGTHACPGPVDVTHADGHRLSIVGAGNAPGDVTLQFKDNGFSVRDAHALALLSNLTVQYTGADDDSVGVVVTRGASLTAARIVVTGFQNGFRVNNSSTLSLKETEATGNEIGYLARGGSSLTLGDLSADGNGFGIYAQENSTVMLNGAVTVSNNSDVGVEVNSGACIIGEGNFAFGEGDNANANGNNISEKNSGIVL